MIVRLVPAILPMSAMFKARLLHCVQVLDCSGVLLAEAPSLGRGLNPKQHVGPHVFTSVEHLKLHKAKVLVESAVKKTVSANPNPLVFTFVDYFMNFKANS